MIEVQGLTKYYADLRRGRFVALDGLTFRALPGQIYGLLGPNGAGKTTALRILSTVLRPSSGTAAVNGFDVVLQPSQVRRQIGFMSANTAVYDRMTAWEMVEYFGRLHGLPPAELTERMESLFEKFKMNDIRDVLGAKMSTGMRQKVSIARAIVHDPPVLIFDEATAGLDVLVARALLAARGRTAGRTASASSSPPTSCARPRSSAIAWRSCTAATSWPRARWRNFATSMARTTWKRSSSN